MLGEQRGWTQNMLGLPGQAGEGPPVSFRSQMAVFSLVLSASLSSPWRLQKRERAEVFMGRVGISATITP